MKEKFEVILINCVFILFTMIVASLFLAPVFLVGINNKNLLLGLNILDSNTTKIINSNDYIPSVSANVSNSSTVLSDVQNSSLKIILNDKIKKLDAYLKGKSISVKYYSLNTGFTYDYNDTRRYFSASLIKLLDILYVFNNNVNLYDTVNYKYAKLVYDKKMLAGDDLTRNATIYDLCEYIMRYSDNRAHTLLVKKLGLKNLVEYNKSLNTTYYITKDYYTSINTSDALIYLKEIYKLLNMNNSNSEFLKDCLSNTHFNRLNIPEMNYYHKYGRTEKYFHDIGISISADNPYILIILTNDGYRYSKVYNDVSKMIYEIDKIQNAIR